MSNGDGNITISKAWIAVLGTILAALISVGAVVWNASSKLQAMQDKIDNLQTQLTEARQDLAAIKAAFYVPNVPQGQKK